MLSFLVVLAAVASTGGDSVATTPLQLSPRPIHRATTGRPGQRGEDCTTTRAP